MKSKKNLHKILLQKEGQNLKRPKKMEEMIEIKYLGNQVNIKVEVEEDHQAITAKKSIKD